MIGERENYYRKSVYLFLAWALAYIFGFSFVILWLLGAFK